MSKVKIKVKQIDFHRNGVAGESFHAILFTHNPEGRKALRFLATVFEGAGCLSVICLDYLEEFGVSHHDNGWRGEYFEAVLRREIEFHQSLSAY